MVRACYDAVEDDSEPHCQSGHRPEVHLFEHEVSERVDRLDDGAVELAAEYVARQSPYIAEDGEQAGVDVQEASEHYHFIEVPDTEVAEFSEEYLPEDEPYDNRDDLVENEGIEREFVLDLPLHGEREVSSQHIKMFVNRLQSMSYG